MSTIIERVKDVCLYLRITENKLATEIGVNPQTLNNYTSGKRKIAHDVVDKILTRYPEISAEWFMRGEGDMIRRESSEVIMSYNTQGDNSCIGGTDAAIIKENEMLKKIIEEKERMIQVLMKDRA